MTTFSTLPRKQNPERVVCRISFTPLIHVQFYRHMPAKESTCPHCPRTFSRPSHLQRHVQSHLDRNLRDMCSCHQCGRRFARNDILIRHLRSFHGDQVHRTRASRKSCTRCVLKKVRCNRGHPCHHCVKAKVDCQYHQNSEIDNLMIENDKLDVVHDVSSRIEIPEQQQHPRTPVEHGTDPGALNDLSTSSSFVLERWFSEPRTGPPRRRETVMAAVPTSSSFTTAEKSTVAALTDPCHSDVLGPFLSSNATFDFGSNDLDWLDVDFSQFDLDQWHPENDSGASTTIGFASPQPPVQGIRTDEASDLQDTIALLGSTDSALAQTERYRGESQGRLCRPRAPVYHWPFDNDCLKPTLPQLKSPVSRPKLSGGFPDRIISAATAPNLPVLDAYFNHFHEILPIIHVPSFNPSECPAILVAALSTIGAMFVRDDSTCKDSWPYSAAYLHLLSSWVRPWCFFLIT